MKHNLKGVLHWTSIYCFRDKSVVNKYFISVFVRLFLEKKERALMKFISDFQKLTMADEKVCT